VREKGGRAVAVGYDGRLSSPGLEAALVDGLAGAGIDVVRVGLGPTPMLYFAASTLGVDGGIMITGSHNPPDYNGFKMMIGRKSVFGGEIQKLGRIAAEGKFPTGQGKVREQPVLDDYVARLLQDYDGKRTLHIAWDPGNGATGAALEKLVAKLPGKHEVINSKIDGSFPAHHPDPTEAKNLRQLQDLVAAKKCDLGIAFDGDGDRIGVVDGQGRILWGDQLMVILGGDVIARQPGATIIADVKASQTLFDRVAELGGQPLMWKTGHSLIKSKMKETGAPLAGEMSGHIFFKHRWFGFDDALYAAVRLIEAVSVSGKSLTEIMDAMPVSVATPEMRFQVDEVRKFAIVDEVRDRLSGDGATVDATDGVRVKTGDGWWLLRASNTQDVLVARAEASDQQGLDRLIGQIDEQLAKSGVERVEAEH